MKQAVAALTTKTNGLQENVTDIETVVNQIASGGSGSTSGIRRIQRDTFDIRNATGITINLTGFTDLNKMVVILNGSAYPNTTMDSVVPFYVDSLSLTNLEIASMYGVKFGTGSYQVIEFY